MRTAIVKSGGMAGDRALEVVRSYLPRNYHAYQKDDNVIIEGEDSHGWTLDGYVIPRLASGLIMAVEVS